MMLLKKSNSQNQKFCFIADSKTCQVFRGFEQLFSIICWGAMLLVRRLKYAWF